MREIVANNTVGKGDIKKYFRQISQGLPNGNRWSDTQFKKWLRSRELAREDIKLAKRKIKPYD